MRYKYGRDKYLAMVSDVATKAHGMMMTNPDWLVWFYFARVTKHPHHLGWGRLLAVRDGKPKPKGAELAAPTPFPCNLTLEQLTDWVHERAGSLSIVGTFPRAYYKPWKKGGE